MALTTTIDRVTGPFAMANRQAVIFQLTPDSAWLAAGEALSKSALGFTARVDLVLFDQAGGYTFAYDYTNEKVLAYYADYSSGTDGALIAVVDDVDLSALRIRGIAFGV